MAAPPLAVLLPNPLPPNTAAAVADSKYPYSGLRKTLRLLIEDPDPLEELENDISYVYSGFAPISVRLVQCVAQKGGVLSNPAAEKERKGAGGEDGAKRASAAPMVQAHPIVGWKGFEDVVASIPGETVDAVQRVPGSQDGAGLPPVSTLSGLYFHIAHADIADDLFYFCPSVNSAAKRAGDHDGGVLPGWGDLH